MKFRNLFKKKAIEEPKTRLYGRDGTIHRNASVDVETDIHGNVVAVWFRCQPLPFHHAIVQRDRAIEMSKMYEYNPIPEIVGVELKD